MKKINEKNRNLIQRTITSCVSEIISRDHRLMPKTSSRLISLRTNRQSWLTKNKKKRPPDDSCEPIKYFLKDTPQMTSVSTLQELGSQMMEFYSKWFLSQDSSSRQTTKR